MHSLVNLPSQFRNPLPYFTIPLCSLALLPCYLWYCPAHLVGPPNEPDAILSQFTVWPHSLGKPPNDLESTPGDFTIQPDHLLAQPGHPLAYFMARQTYRLSVRHVKSFYNTSGWAGYTNKPFDKFSG